MLTIFEVSDPPLCRETCITRLIEAHNYFVWTLELRSGRTGEIFAIVLAFANA
jgi:hypothetical protein